MVLAKFYSLSKQLEKVKEELYGNFGTGRYDIVLKLVVKERYTSNRWKDLIIVEKNKVSFLGGDDIVGLIDLIREMKLIDALERFSRLLNELVILLKQFKAMGGEDGE